MTQLNDNIAELRLLNKYRRNYIRQKTALENRMKGMIAAENGYDPSNGNDTELFDEAKKVVDGLLAKKQKGDIDLILMMTGFVNAHKAITTSIKEIEKTMTGYAKDLPVYEWAKTIPGLGETTLVKLVAEIGGVNNNGLADFDCPAKVWKRMGVGVVSDGTRQRRVKGDAALEHGYDGQRRAEVYLACQWIIMKGKAGNHPLYQYYVAEKARQLAKPDVKTEGHAHARAKIHMGKKMLKWMWREWNCAVKELPKAA